MAVFMGVELKNKIFMTGIIGSGKTTIGKKIASANGLKYVDLDLFFDYEISYNQSKKVLKRLPSEFLIDGIPPNEKKYGKRNWEDFSLYEYENDVTIICVYCSDKMEWIDRIKNRIDGRRYKDKHFVENFFCKLKRRIIRFYVCCRNIRNSNDLKIEIGKLKKSGMGKNVDLKGMYGVLYRDFINSFYSRLCDYRDVKYYDSSINRFTTEEDFIKSIKKSIEDGELFKLNLNIKASGGDSIPPEAKIV